MKKLEFTAFDTLKAIVKQDERRIEFWIIEPEFLIGVIPYAENEDFREILKNVDSLTSMKREFEKHKHLFGLMAVTG